jgi:integrase
MYGGLGDTSTVRRKQKLRKLSRKQLGIRKRVYLPNKLTVSDYLEDWLESQKGVVPVRTLIVKEGNLRVHVYPTLGNKRLSKLTAKDIRGIYQGKDLKPATVNTIMGTFSQALDDAVGKYIRVNPAREIKKLRQNREEMKILPPNQVKKLLPVVC